MKSCVIIGGGEINDWAAIKKHIPQGADIICCDAGYLHAQKMGLSPSLIVGDFDSSARPDTDIETLVLPCEKDDTDSFFAAKTALLRGYTDFTLLGMTGGRLDHTLAAISVLEHLDKNGATAALFDENTRIRVTRETIDVTDSCRYFSVFAIGHASGVTITGAKYCLDNADIDSSYQYGVSNEPCGMPRVSVKSGKLIVMEIFN